MNNPITPVVHQNTKQTQKNNTKIEQVYWQETTYVYDIT